MNPTTTNAGNISPSHHKTFLGDIPLGMRISALLLLGVAAVLLIIAQVSIANTTIERAIQQSKEWQELHQHSVNISLGVLEMERNQNNFLRSNELSYFQDYHQHAKDVQASLLVLESNHFIPSEQLTLSADNLDHAALKQKEVVDTFLHRLHKIRQDLD